MSDAIVMVDTSEIHAGKLEDVSTAVKQLVEFVAANEPRMIAYNVYIDEAAHRMTVVQVHPDSESMETHMQLAGPAFKAFAGLLRLQAIDIYGSPSSKLLEQMHRKAELLGGATVAVHELHAGVSHLGAG